MYNDRRIARVFLLATVAAIASHSPAFAQSVDNSASAQGAGASGVGGDIIVTATRRAESTLSVPLSIAALDTESLIKSNIKNVADIARTVPGLSFNTNPASLPGAGQIGMTVRAVSSPVGEPTTGYYLDEVPLTGVLFGTPGGNIQPAGFDFQRIEVLRGPQGTLFGAGAMGGAVRFIQNKPNLTEVSGRAVGEVGFIEDGGISGEIGVAAGAPIVQDKLGIRVSAWQRWQGGFIDRYDPLIDDIADKNANRVRTQVGSAAITWAPTDGFKITPSIFYQARKTPHINAIHEFISDLDEHQYRNAGAEAAPTNDRFWIPALTIEGDLGFADLVSVSSLLRRHTESVTDITTSFGVRLPILYGLPDGFGNPIHPAIVANPSDTANQTVDLKVRSFSQEVRLVSSDPDSRLTWTVGAYYQKTKMTDRTAWPEQEPAQIFGGFDYDTEIKVTQEQLAAFAQVDFEVLDGLKLTAGGRIQRVKVSLQQTNMVPAVPVPSFAEGVAEPFIPKFGIEYQIDPENLVYASAGKGFRSGGVNPPLPNVPGCGDTLSPIYDPDSLWSYEIGTKNRLFDNTLTFAASAFHIEWSNIQTGVYIQACGTGPTVNAGKAEINGFDAAISFTPTPALRADLSVAYNDAKFSEDVFDDFAGPGGPRPVARDGDAISQTIAPWTLTGSLEYTVPMGDNEAYFRAENSYRTRNPGPFIFQDPRAQSFGPFRRADPAYNVLSLRAGVRLQENLDIALFVNNALNAQPLLARTNFVKGNDYFFSGTIVPRTAGVNVNLNF